MRVSMDCKATVKIGEYSRGAQTRGDNQAFDHAMGCQETYTPFGVVNEDTGQLHLSFGSSAKTSEVIVDSLYAWWGQQAPEARADVGLVQIKVDNGPESSAELRTSRSLARDALGKATAPCAPHPRSAGAR
jgi:hypothetical protein